jgi:hypothetical protein
MYFRFLATDNKARHNGVVAKITEGTAPWVGDHCALQRHPSGVSGSDLYSSGTTLRNPVTLNYICVKRQVQISVRRLDILNEAFRSLLSPPQGYR